ncbi:MAG: ABC transporter permease, partial [Dehalococcoidia bacterium]
VAPAFGPGFEASADRLGGPNVVVLSDALWRSRFASDRTVLGRPVTLDDEPYVVVGVMPSTFENVTAPLAEAWALMQYDAALPTFDGREWGHHLDMIGLLREGVDSEDALRELNGIADRPVAEFARPDWAALARGLSLRPLREATTARARPTMLALAGAVGLLLVIACVNVTILLLARGAQRQGELAMRVALGAGRGRLVRQLLTESLLLAGLGGVVGIVVARLGIAGLVALIPPDLPRVNAIALDGAALAFALGITTLIGVLVGLIPALAPSGGELHQALREARATSAGRNRSTQRGLVVTEVALALVLLVGAGLLLRSMQHLFGIPPGFDPSQVVVMQVHTAGFQDDNATHRFFDQALDAVQQLPGVASAALTSQLPLSGEDDQYGVTLEEDAGEGVDGSAYRHVVSADYFETMGIPLLRGRRLGRQDITGATPAVVVSEALARRTFPGREAIGQRMHVGRTDLPWFTVAGVVGDVKQMSLEADQAEAVYVTPEQWYFADRVRWLVVRADVDAAALIPAIRRAIWSVDSNQPIARIQSMDDLVARSEAQRHFVLIVLEVFALLALTLAGIGLYGVLSGSVTERMREMGVRAALGASPESILALVVRQGMTLTAVGVAIGLVGAVAASEALVAQLYDVSRLDAVTYLSVVTLLAVVSAVACWIPAARAARVDPLTTLRAD